MSVHTRIVLGTLCVFNALILLTLGLGSLFFVDGVAARIVAGGFGLAAVLLFALARRLRRGTQWND